MQKQFKGFKEGGRYLVSDKPYYKENLVELIVLEISEKAIKIQWHKELVEWYLKDDNLPFTLIEELPIKKQAIEDRSHEIQFEDDFDDFDVGKKPKLEWQQNSLEERMTWYQAMTYADSLGEGWRLPTRAELINAYYNYIEDFQSYYYWSLNTYTQNTNVAWYIYFGNFMAESYSLKTYKYYVRCVREVAK